MFHFITQLRLALVRVKIPLMLISLSIMHPYYCWRFLNMSMSDGIMMLPKMRTGHANKLNESPFLI
ncbi:hypothetical protein KL86CLO1_11705 [uncultured Eubacteriales bacterium]|uniref:Uncharacterized protein n=1 Tax=uncultured Eubacteriales bacterium TaxID=172733 RepID=A0A212JTU4_9FIRM|nr:hypothetical protein KL86CLO1_11705 [uncultured Eubacteriales bacterium]